jgi:hypothetical protein
VEEWVVTPIASSFLLQRNKAFVGVLFLLEAQTTSSETTGEIGNRWFSTQKFFGPLKRTSCLLASQQNWLLKSQRFT